MLYRPTNVVSLACLQYRHRNMVVDVMTNPEFESEVAIYSVKFRNTTTKLNRKWNCSKLRIFICMNWHCLRFIHMSEYFFVKAYGYYTLLTNKLQLNKPNHIQLIVWWTMVIRTSMDQSLALKLMVTQPVKKSPTYDGTRVFVTVCATLARDRWINFIPSHPMF
jgi:hypothetical protein